MVKVTTFFAVLCFLSVLGLGQVSALTWDFDKEADVEEIGKDFRHSVRPVNG